MISVRTILPAGLLFLLLASPALAQTLDTQALTEALNSPQRELTDRLRDPVRKPVEVLAFLGVRPGMTALDVYAAGGYFTVVLAKAVGPEGRVYAQNTPRGLRFEEDRSDITQGEALEAKLQANDLQNVIRLDQRLSEIDLAPESIDVVLVSQILHDYHNGSPDRTQRMLAKIREVLKPGGVLGIIDHYGAEGLDNTRLHRMVKEDAIAAVEEAGFMLDAESDLLRVEQDDYRRSIFDPMLNRTTDQFLLRFRKP